MKNSKSKLSYNFKYTFYLISDLAWVIGMSFLLYTMSNGYLFIVYFVNVLFIIGVLTEEKFWWNLFEKWFYKLKKDGFIKRRLKELLVSSTYRPSTKVVLYVYYLICIAAERLLYFGVAKDIVELINLKDYLTTMYYSFILLMALDKVREVMGKENYRRQEYYAKFNE